MAIHEVTKTQGELARSTARQSQKSNTGLNTAQIAQNIQTTIQGGYTSKQTRGDLASHVVHRTLRQRNLRLPEHLQHEAPILDEEVCEQLFGLMNGLPSSTRFLKAKHRLFLNQLQNHAEGEIELISEQDTQTQDDDTPIGAALKQQLGEDDTPANRYLLMNYALKQSKDDEQIKQLKQALQTLYDEQGRLITTNINSLEQAQAYGKEAGKVNRQKIKLFQDAYYKLLEELSDFSTMAQFCLECFEVEHFLEVTNLITQAAMAHQQAQIMPCLHQESIHTLLSFMNKRSILHTCIEDLRKLLIQQGRMVDVPKKQHSELEHQCNQDNQQDQSNQKNQEDAQKQPAKTEEVRGKQPAEKILRDMLKLLLDLTQGHVILAIEGQLVKLNELLIDYRKVSLRQVREVERKALQHILALLRNLATGLWQEDAVRLKTLETLYELLGQYNSQVEYSPINRDKYFV